LRKLTHLNLGHNGLYSEDLSPLFQSLHLNIFNLSHNSINASIPSSISALNVLSVMDLSYNHMYGEIPSAMYTLRTMTRLSLGNNKLSGPVDVFLSDLTELDLSNNMFSGTADVAKGLVSVTYLNISHNQFSGLVPDFSQKLNLETIDLSDNLLTGSLFSLNALTSLEVLKLHNNQLNGSMPSISNLNKLKVVDVSNNRLEDNRLMGAIPPSVESCGMMGNLFECPVTWQSVGLCGAQCSTPSDNGTAVLRMRVKGDLATFDKGQFIRSLSLASNTTQDRFSILSLESGSVIATVQVQPATGVPNEGTAIRTANILAEMAKSGSVIGDYEVVSDSVVNPATTVQTSERKESNTGMIVGVVVGCVALAAIAVVVGAIVYHRAHKPRSLYENQLAMIDLKSINLGEAKSSITPWDELANLKEIGSGAFGIVYKADWRGLNVAVKQIRAEHVTQAQLSDFMGEVALLQRLRPHPVSCPFFDITLTFLTERGALVRCL